MPVDRPENSFPGRQILEFGDHQPGGQAAHLLQRILQRMANLVHHGGIGIGRGFWVAFHIDDRVQLEQRKTDGLNRAVMQLGTDSAQALLVELDAATAGLLDAAALLFDQLVSGVHNPVEYAEQDQTPQQGDQRNQLATVLQRIEQCRG